MILDNRIFTCFLYRLSQVSKFFPASPFHEEPIVVKDNEKYQT